MRYFAYGSNLFEARLKARVPNASFVEVARLQNHALRFHKRSDDGSAKCNVVLSVGDVVIGAIFEVPPEEKSVLDHAEGLGQGYEERAVVVLNEDGSARTPVTYVATEEHIDDSLQPYTWYKEYVIRGARNHGFPDGYIEVIALVAA